MVPPENLYGGVVLEEGSMVDADYKGRRFTGVVIKKMEEDGRYLVYFDILSDIVEFERKHLRVHLERNGSKWVRADVKEVSKSIFSSGTLVEVSFGIGKGEVSWVSAMIIKEIEESGKKKLILKFCDKSFRFISDGPAKTMEIADLSRVRPTPPTLSVKEYNLLDCVEMFYGLSWRPGIVMKVLAEKRYLVSLKATGESVSVKHFDLRRFRVWEDGVWDIRSIPLDSENSKHGSRKRKIEETDKLDLNETRGTCNGSEAEICDKGKTFCIDGDDDDVVDDQLLSAELTYYESPAVVNGFAGDVKETPVAQLVSPFEKTSPFWKTCETNELYNSVPQSPHFIQLFDVREDMREMSAIGMMMDFYALLDEVKSLQLDVSPSKLSSLNNSFAKLKKYGFIVASPQSLICKVLSLQDGRAKKADERKFLEEEIQANKMIRQKAEQEMTELQRKSMVAREKKVAADKKIVETESRAKTIDQEVEDLELEFQTTVSAAW